MNVLKTVLFALVMIFALTLMSGCSDRDPAGLDIARATIDPLVFTDDLGDDVYFQPFFETYYETMKRDSVETYNSEASLRMTIPGRDSSLGPYSGGVLTSGGKRDLADFNALTFYAKSSVLSQLNVVGFGNDNTGNSLYEAGRSNVSLNNTWTFVVIPIPSPGKLVAERGLFTFAEGFEALYPAGHQLWFDEIKFAHLENITNPRPVMTSVNKQYFTGAKVALAGTYTLFDVDGADIRVDHSPNYFDFTSQNAAVATVENGQVQLIAPGTTVINASMDGVEAAGMAVLSVYDPPAAAAPQPTLPASDVISMFSGAYPNVPVGTWDTNWQYSTAEDSEYSVDGNVAKMYAALNFVGIDFSSLTVDASDMTHLHLDVFAPVGTNFRVKIVAFNGDGGLVIGQSELTFDATTTPAFTAGDWASLDIPLEDFGLTAPLDHVGQLVLSTDDAQLVLVDNIYWHK